MKSIVISTETQELLRAHSDAAGRRLVSEAVWVGRGWQVYVDDEVYDQLMKLDPDPDRAIRLAACGLYGHS